MNDEAKIVGTGTIALEAAGGLSIHADVVTWAERQAALLRRIGAGETVNDQVDWDDIAEEIESLGVSERRSLASHVRNIIEHLAKLHVSPAPGPRAGWRDTVLRARADVLDLLEASPSLRPGLGEVVARQHARALALAASALETHGETPRGPLELLRYTPDQVIGDWFPDVA
jgi:hypothetical protein